MRVSLRVLHATNVLWLPLHGDDPEYEVVDAVASVLATRYPLLRVVAKKVVAFRAELRAQLAAGTLVPVLDTTARPRCVALARHLLAVGRERGVELPATVEAVDALDTGHWRAQALAQAAIHSAPEGPGNLLARTIERLVEHAFVQRVEDEVMLRNAIQALRVLGVGGAEARLMVDRAWGGT